VVFNQSSLFNTISTSSLHFFFLTLAGASHVRLAEVLQSPSVRAAIALPYELATKTVQQLVDTALNVWILDISSKLNNYLWFSFL